MVQNLEANLEQKKPSSSSGLPHNDFAKQNPIVNQKLHPKDSWRWQLHGVTIILWPKKFPKEY